jgi:YD repeat-containing protein
MSVGRTEWLALAAVCVTLLPVQAFGQETTTYTYDALGRVITVQHSGGPTDGTAATYSYDPASNRTNVTVTLSGNGGGGGSGGGSGGSGDPGAGASVPSRPIFIVVPLNGYSVIPITGS